MYVETKDSGARQPSAQSIVTDWQLVDPPAIRQQASAGFVTDWAIDDKAEAPPAKVAQIGPRPSPQLVEIIAQLHSTSVPPAPRQQAGTDLFELDLRRAIALGMAGGIALSLLVFFIDH
jgi:hypothetical protein